MQLQDLEALKDVPGYKAILKAVIKSQIQSLLQQLSEQTDEESVILTASVSDGSLCHLGSNVGQDFLQGRDEIKSQFLRHCLKKRHGSWEPDMSGGNSLPHMQPLKKKKLPQGQYIFAGSMSNTNNPFHAQQSLHAKFKGSRKRKPVKLPVRAPVEFEQHQSQTPFNFEHVEQHQDQLPTKFEQQHQSQSGQVMAIAESQLKNIPDPGVDMPQEDTSTAAAYEELANKFPTESQSGYSHMSLEEEAIREMQATVVTQSVSDINSSLQQQQLSDSGPVLQQQPETTQSCDNGQLRVKEEPGSEEDVQVTGFEVGDQSVNVAENPDWSVDEFTVTTNYGDSSIDTDMKAGYVSASTSDYAAVDSYGDQRAVCGICGQYSCEHMGTSPPKMAPYVTSANIATTMADEMEKMAVLVGHGHDGRGSLDSKWNKSNAAMGMMKRAKHKCEVCGKSFITRSILVRHMLIHTGEKRHECDICFRRFIQKCTRDRHMLVHLKGN